MAQALRYPTTQNYVQKTLNAQLLAGVTAAATFNNVTSIQNLPGVMIVDRVDSTGTETPTKREVIQYTATSGSTVITLTRNADGSGSDQDHQVGAIVEFGPDVLWAQSVIDGLTQILVPSTGVLDTTKVADLTTAQTFTNKIFTSPVVNTGISGTAIDTDGTLAGNLDTKLASQKAVKTYVDANAGGWTTLSSTLAYSSADGHTFVVTSSADMTGSIGVGDRVKFTNNSTTFYGIVTAISSSTITLYGGALYTVANSAITSPFYSHAKAPFGFSLNPDNWTEEVTDSSFRSQASPVNGTWYNLNAAFQIAIPIGMWNTEYQCSVYGDRGSGDIEVGTTLSTANNSESDADFTSYAAGNALAGASFQVYKRKNVSLLAKTTYYLNAVVLVVSMNTLGIFGSHSHTKIRAICAYL